MLLWIWECFEVPTFISGIVLNDRRVNCNHLEMLGNSA